jgi:hypothetical protein
MKAEVRPTETRWLKAFFKIRPASTILFCEPQLLLQFRNLIETACLDLSSKGARPEGVLDGEDQ